MPLNERDIARITRVVKAEVAPIQQALFGTEEDREAGLCYLVRKHEQIIPTLSMTNKVLAFLGGIIAVTLVGILFKVLFHI